MARKKSEKTIYTGIAKDAIAGKYGYGSTRRHKIMKAGYDWNKVQTYMYKLQK